MTGQLFSSLPQAPRPPRRLRLIGFQLEQLERETDALLGIVLRIDHTRTRLAALVARAKAAGRIHSDAYRLIVKSDEQLDYVNERLGEIDIEQQALERRLERGIERHLARLGNA